MTNLHHKDVCVLLLLRGGRTLLSVAMQLREQHGVRRRGGAPAVVGGRRKRPELLGWVPVPRGRRNDDTPFIHILGKSSQGRVMAMVVAAGGPDEGHSWGGRRVILGTHVVWEICEAPDGKNDRRRRGSRRAHRQPVRRGDRPESVDLKRDGGLDRRRRLAMSAGLGIRYTPRG